ncbi:unnamed protein product [Peronospora destructor]|uniref:MIT domain-containing protein n=1 Tax=Peronospora destructor TaxID=86335 RepID=A0AAV0V2N5_9STRA|nr:unnamed protein product [Peronospora destructor]
MAGSMDLEARLRALRSSKRSPAPSPALSLTPVSSLTLTDSIAKASSVQKQISVTIAGRDGYSSLHSTSSVVPRVNMINCCSSNNSACFAPIATSIAPLRALELAPAHEEVLQLTTAQLLGPEYEKAVKAAQFAIDRERRQMPHAAIDAYIEAGQMLIEIGRQQAAPHLQDIVKTKALALLQRAEGLSEWTNEVLAKDSSQQALAAAYQQSQQNRNKSLTEKQELVSKMQQDNRNMKERLNQLALLTRIRGRMVKVVKTRRARKTAEKEEAEAAVQASTRSNRGGFNDVTGEVNEYLYGEGEDSYGGLNDVTGSSSDEDDEPRNSYQHHHASATSDSPREAQKVGLINELHERIGLPQIDQFRKFEPLTNDRRTDEKQKQLQSELEVAKQEADKLRAAVQEMERCLQLAAQHSKQRSIKLEQRKAQEFAKVQSELDRLREQLEIERRRSTSSLHSGPSSWSSWRSSVASDPGGGETKNTGKLGYVQSSLAKVFRGRNEQPGGFDNVHNRRASEHSSTTQSYDMDEEETEEDDDGGVWL